jgi:glutamine amidotransferase PdxT
LGVADGHVMLQGFAATLLQVEKPADIMAADKLIFPGVGSFGQAMRILTKKGMVEPLKDYINVRMFHSLTAQPVQTTSTCCVMIISVIVKGVSSSAPPVWHGARNPS